MDIQAASPIRFQTITAIPSGGRTGQFAVSRDQHVEGTVVSVEGDTVVVSIGSQRVEARATGQLNPGDQLRMLVREAGPDRVVMQIVARGDDATTMRPLADADLRDELARAGVPADGPSLSVARALIAAGQPVTAEAVLDVRGALARARALDPESLRAAVFLKAQGLPLTANTLAVARQALAASSTALGQQVQQLREALASLATRLTTDLELDAAAEPTGVRSGSAAAGAALDEPVAAGDGAAASPAGGGSSAAPVSGAAVSSGGATSVSTTAGSPTGDGAAGPAGTEAGGGGGASRAGAAPGATGAGDPPTPAVVSAGPAEGAAGRSTPAGDGTGGDAADGPTGRGGGPAATATPLEPGPVWPASSDPSAQMEVGAAARPAGPAAASTAGDGASSGAGAASSPTGPSASSESAPSAATVGRSASAATVAAAAASPATAGQVAAGASGSAPGDAVATASGAAVVGGASAGDEAAPAVGGAVPGPVGSAVDPAKASRDAAATPAVATPSPTVERAAPVDAAVVATAGSAPPAAAHAPVGPAGLAHLLERISHTLATLPSLDGAAVRAGREHLAATIHQIVSDQSTPVEAKLARLLDGLASRAELESSLSTDLRSTLADLVDGARRHGADPGLPSEARADLQVVQDRAESLLGRIDLQQLANAAHAARPGESYVVLQLPMPGRDGPETAEIRLRQEGQNRKIDPRDVHVVFQFQLRGLQTVRVSLRVLQQHLSCQVGSSDAGATELLRQHAGELRSGLGGLGYLVDDVRCAQLTPEELAPPAASPADAAPTSPRRVLRLDARA